MTPPFHQDTPVSVINLTPALVRLENDRELLRDLAVFFVEDSPQLIHELESAIEMPDFETITRCAHSLKGLGANFDANRFVSVAKEIEQSGRQRDLPAILRSIPALRDEGQQVIEALHHDLLN